jgi:hypothetical protein
MSGRWTREVLNCPRCGYDVTQTIADQFSVCPECGGFVSAETCYRAIESLPKPIRRFMYASWLGVFPALASGLALGSVGLVLAAGVVATGAVYVGWWRMEHWFGGAVGASRRAIGPALATMTVMGAGFFCLLVAWVFLFVR